MANQLNFGSPITTMVAERVPRLTPTDQGLVSIGTKSILFGTSPFDNVEIWFYNPDGSFFNGTVLGPTDPAISISTIFDANGGNEVLNIDFDKVALYVNLIPGRYSVAIYILRDEVGNIRDKGMIIDEISTSRTEVKISAPVPSEVLFKQVYEFVVPSVPPMYAKGLVDEVFAKSLDYNPDWSESLNGLDVSRQLNTHAANTTDRIVKSEAGTSYANLFNVVKDRTYTLAIELLVEQSKADRNIQYPELKNIILASLKSVLANMVDIKEIDSRFVLV